MSRGLARTYGSHAITVNTVSPGLDRHADAHHRPERRTRRGAEGPTPLGRVAEPHELAATVLFLASRHAGYITGATINVSGGFLMY